MSTDILYFDYWTRGVRHFSNVDLRLKASGLNTLLVHLGSQRGEALEENPIISGIRCVDLKSYGNNLVSMLLAERPKVVLLLNNQTEDKIIVRASRRLGIKTVFLMHGILTSCEKRHQGAQLVDSAFGLTARLVRIPKYIRLFLHYLSAAMLHGWQDVFDAEIYLYFIRQAISPGGNLVGKWTYIDSCADLALVYSEEDKETVKESHKDA